MNRAQIIAIAAGLTILTLCAIAPTAAILATFPISIVAQHLMGEQA